MNSSSAEEPRATRARTVAAADASSALGQRKWALSVSVVVGAAILQSVPQVLTGHDHVSVVTRLGFWILQMLILLAALSASYRYAMKRRFGSTHALFTTLFVAAVLGALFGLMTCFLRQEFPILRWNPERPLLYPAAAAFGAVLGVFQCGIWALAFVYPSAAEDSRLRALESEKFKLEAEKLKLEAEQLRAAAELGRLRSQLEPHFLLNTLNAIAGLVTSEPREARRLLACLGDLLSDALRDSDEMQTLGEEVAWLNRYAQILESRHKGALSFCWEISEATRSCLIPRLLLQPLLENAVKHGALCRRGSGRVLVRAAIATRGGGLRLLCSIEDNGPGIPSGPTRSGALGLFAVRRRLELRYGDAELRLESSKSGTRAIVDLPYDHATSRSRLQTQVPLEKSA